MHARREGEPVVKRPGPSQEWPFPAPELALRPELPACFSGFRLHIGEMDPTRTALLSLHRALVDAERRAYEKTHGRIADGEFLQALTRDPSLAWLAPLTSL